MASQKMSDLADIIDKNTKIVTAYYSDHQIPAPSVDTSSPFTAIIHDEKVAAARFAALAAMHELKCLMLGPTEALMSVEVRLFSMVTSGRILYLPSPSPRRYFLFRPCTATR